MSTSLVEAPQARPVGVTRSAPPAPFGKRLFATLIDFALLGAILVWIVAMEFVFYGELEAMQWLLLLWIGIVGPMYFGLYHAYGTGATPGQLDVGVAVRDPDTNGLVGLARGIARAYLGLVAPLVVLDVFAATYTGRPRLWRDEWTRTNVVSAPDLVRGETAFEPTVPALEQHFEPDRGGDYLRRAMSLVGEFPKALIGAVLVVYLALIVIIAVLAPLFMADFSADDWSGIYALYAWLDVALITFVGGVFWSQATIVAAAELVRTGREASLRAVLRSVIDRVNALAAAALLLALIAVVAASLWVTVVAVLAALWAITRMTLVVPAIAIENHRVSGAIARSWRLTRGRTWRTLGMVVGSVVIVAVAVGVAVALGVAFAGAVDPDAPPLTWALVIATGMGLGSLVTGAILAWLGTAWFLVYHDARIRVAKEVPPDAPAG